MHVSIVSTATKRTQVSHATRPVALQRRSHLEMDKPLPKRPSDAKLDPGSPTDPAGFGRYLFLGMIARGGMAEVYRAKEESAELGPEGALYAVKCMRPQPRRRRASSRCS